MVTWREAPVTSPTAIRLLTEYFNARAAGFPGGPSGYHATHPGENDFLQPNGVFLIVLCEADVSSRPVAVGCGGIRRAPAGEASDIRFEVKHLWLQPRARGRGSGRALLEELESRARGFGATELVLDTNSSLEAATGLYRSSGFVSIAPYNDNPNATNWYGKQLV